MEYTLSVFIIFQHPREERLGPCSLSTILHFCGRALAEKRKACCFKFEVWSEEEGERGAHEAFAKG